MLSLAKAEELAEALAKSPYQSFRVDQLCGHRERLMGLEAVYEHNIPPEFVGRICLRTFRDIPFNTKPILPNTFVFEDACRKFGADSFVVEPYRFSILKNSDGCINRYRTIANIHITQSDGTVMLAEDGRDRYNISGVQGSTAYDEHWATILETEEGQRIVDPHMKDGLITIQEWKELCGAEHGVILIAAKNSPELRIDVQHSDMGTLTSMLGKKGIDVPEMAENKMQAYFDGLPLEEKNKVIGAIRFQDNFVPEKQNALMLGIINFGTINDDLAYVRKILAPLVAYQNWYLGIARGNSPSIPNPALRQGS